MRKLEEASVVIMETGSGVCRFLLFLRVCGFDDKGGVQLEPRSVVVTMIDYKYEYWVQGYATTSANTCQHGPFVKKVCT